eukprot:GEMP01038777.1.p1 GENE.GEMP01038777.1~~GEMP01038777.1.p1  ORF type:complete len:152 (-),score=28.30 GEMP01038777.1:1329-1784(-)
MATDYASSDFWSMSTDDMIRRNRLLVLRGDELCHHIDVTLDPTSLQMPGYLTRSTWSEENADGSPTGNTATHGGFRESSAELPPAVRELPSSSPKSEGPPRSPSLGFMPGITSASVLYCPTRRMLECTDGSFMGYDDRVLLAKQRVQALFD